MNSDNSSLRYVHDVSKNPGTSLAKLIDRIRPNSTVLEIGPASGAMTKVLRDKGCKVSIVEMDKDCFDIAIQYAETGVCCDFETYAWTTSFSEQQFDYVVFADVLEHLRNPKNAIAEAGKYLKDDGSLLISVPNIGHNSIIIQLINNQFMYQSTGLLDYTHIRHFTFLELEKMYTETNYKPVYIDATYVAVGKNEFDVSYADVDPFVAEQLRNRPFGEVYQHLCELKKEQYFNSNHLVVDNRIGEPKTFVDGDYNVIKLAEQEVCNTPNYVFASNKEVADVRLKLNNLYAAFPDLNHVESLRERIYSYQEEVREKNKHIVKLNSHIEELDDAIRYLQKENSDQKTKLDEKQKEVDEKQKELDEKQKEIDKKQKEIDEKQEELDEKQKEIDKKQKEIDEHVFQLDSQKYELDKKNELIIDKNRHIQNIEAQIALDNQKINELQLPADKWNRFIMFFPIRALRYIKRNIKKLYFHTKEKKYEKLVVPSCRQPKVSIIIPVYNQFDYTYACIKSIIETVKDVSYEIIIGDDMSTDRTKRIKKYISGIRVNMNRTDHGFLMNCNRAAKLAKGDYIVFLNNDTQVKEEWLSSLVQLIESDDKIGMVGSKLVYPDGRLQEAGGIIWDDASGWNYGREQDANMPEYNYVREVDYISGASIMIYRNLWEKIGGFDPYFAPAYCEDSDLAFQVRQQGYKVMYQPKSVVVHFEGVSNGTDLNEGLKKYQVENNRKFREKWAEELKCQYPSGQDAFLARERNRGKKVILIIDHYVPTYDKDAGSKTTFQYIKMFLKKGYVVKFIGDNYAQMEPYTTILQQMGVEVLYGPWYAQHIFEWIDMNKQYIDIAYLNRPHITEKYIDYLKENTDIKLIYYGHDLHFLRTQREAEIEGNEDKIVESKMWKYKEFDIMKKASVSYYPSIVEEEAIHEIDPSVKVKAITAYVFDTFKENYQYNYAKREGIMFVGGFSHGPNIDAVKWFVEEIWPEIHRCTDANFYIVGSNAPDEIKNLDGDGIVFKGFVSDEELSRLYEECRMIVVPLRYGAGVKGKVVEAIYNGLPIITTSVGAEGISGVEEIAAIADDAQEFANQVVKLYTDGETLERMAQSTQRFIKDNFSEDAVWSIIKEDFE